MPHLVVPARLFCTCWENAHNFVDNWNQTDTSNNTKKNMITNNTKHLFSLNAHIEINDAHTWLLATHTQIRTDTCHKHAHTLKQTSRERFDWTVCRVLKKLWWQMDLRQCGNALETVTIWCPCKSLTCFLRIRGHNPNLIKEHLYGKSFQRPTLVLRVWEPQWSLSLVRSSAQSESSVPPLQSSMCFAHAFKVLPTDASGTSAWLSHMSFSELCKMSWRSHNSGVVIIFIPILYEVLSLDFHWCSTFWLQKTDSVYEGRM